MYIYANIIYEKVMQEYVLYINPKETRNKIKTRSKSYEKEIG